MDQVAYAVHNEYPGYHPANLIYRMVQGDYGDVVIDNAIIRKRCNVQFLHRDFMLADMNTWALNFVGPHNFALKWYIGRPRPEVRCLFVCLCVFLFLFYRRHILLLLY